MRKKASRGKQGVLWLGWGGHSSREEGLAANDFRGKLYILTMSGLSIWGKCPDRSLDGLDLSVECYVQALRALYVHKQGIGRCLKKCLKVFVGVRECS